jgi:ABC-type multidrug transport system ATPase subunit
MQKKLEIVGFITRNELMRFFALALRIGVCPQHDVLFEKLTARETIILFSLLKGATLTFSEAEAEADELLKIFQLQNRADHVGAELSGGMKRKVSVAIAVCGGSKFILLDEPTSGMGTCRSTIVMPCTSFYALLL